MSTEFQIACNELVSVLSFRSIPVAVYSGTVKRLQLGNNALALPRIGRQETFVHANTSWSGEHAIFCCLGVESKNSLPDRTDYKIYFSDGKKIDFVVVPNRTVGTIIHSWMSNCGKKAVIADVDQLYFFHNNNEKWSYLGSDLISRSENVFVSVMYPDNVIEEFTPIFIQDSNNQIYYSKVQWDLQIPKLSIDSSWPLATRANVVASMSYGPPLILQQLKCSQLNLCVTLDFNQPKWLNVCVEGNPLLNRNNFMFMSADARNQLLAILVEGKIFLMKVDRESPTGLEWREISLALPSNFNPKRMFPFRDDKLNNGLFLVDESYALLFSFREICDYYYNFRQAKL